MASASLVGEELPLKQGLKLGSFSILNSSSICWRGTSIKTRIETYTKRKVVGYCRVSGNNQKDDINKLC